MCEIINISMRSVGLDVQQGTVTSLMEASEDELSDMRKDNLLSMLAKIGRKQPSSLWYNYLQPDHTERTPRLSNRSC